MTKEQKVAWANALWEQQDRQESFEQSLVDCRLRLKRLRERKSSAMAAAAVRGRLARAGKDGTSAAATTGTDGTAAAATAASADISWDQLRIAKAALAEEVRKEELLNSGLKAKELQLADRQRQLEQLREAREALLAEAACKQRRTEELRREHEAAFRTFEEWEEMLGQNVDRARVFHNEYLSQKGNIRVFCRFRPTLTNDSSPPARAEFLDDQRFVLHSELQKNVTGLSEHTTTWDFGFDRVFGPATTQSDVFDEISLLVQSALDGYKVAIFAYGQTGGGKTHTMSGPEGSTAAGVIPRSIDLIFAEASAMRQKGWTFDVHVSYLEIYNEVVRDLLSESQHGESPGHTSGVAGRKVRVTAAAEVHVLLRRAAKDRHVAATNCNERSSRSHTVCQLSLTAKRKKGTLEEEVRGVLSFVDLAGSERVEKSGATGERLKEAQHINRSLSALGDVIEALVKRGQQGTTSGAPKHIPYRNSKLTMLLKDSLGGESKALMFVNVSPCLQHLQETVSSLRFASKVHVCNIGVATRNAKDGSTETVLRDK